MVGLSVSFRVTVWYEKGAFPLYPRIVRIKNPSYPLCYNCAMSERLNSPEQAPRPWWPHASAHEKLRRAALYPYVHFGPRDRQLQEAVDIFATRADKYMNDYGADAASAVVLVVGENIPAKSDLIGQCSLNMNIIKPHRLVERFDQGEVPVCLDVALMSHLVWERLGVEGTHIVAYMEQGKPSFAPVSGSSIFLYDSRRWRNFDAFERYLSNVGRPLLKGIYP